MVNIAKQRQKRRDRVRRSVKKLANGRPRLSVFRSNNHIHAQIIDDLEGKTLVQASTLEKDLVKGVKSTSNSDAANKIGLAIAERAKKAGVSDVVFDRGAYMYHGRVKSLANAAREAGLNF